MLHEPQNPFAAPAAAPVVSAPLDLRMKVADELDRMREDLEELGVALCMLDESVMTRCMTHLQRLDEMSQRTYWLADLVRADEPESRLDDITLQSLADRLKG